MAILGEGTLTPLDERGGLEDALTEVGVGRVHARVHDGDPDSLSRGPPMRAFRTNRVRSVLKRPVRVVVSFREPLENLIGLYRFHHWICAEPRNDVGNRTVRRDL